MFVSDVDKRAAITDIYRSLGQGYLTDAVRSQSVSQSRRVYECALALSRILARVPVHVIPCTGRRPYDADSLAAASTWASIIPAGWSFLLALRARGLGSVWTTLHLARAGDVADLLGILDPVSQAALFPVAFTIGTDFKRARRPPAETITSRNTCGSA